MVRLTFQPARRCTVVPYPPWSRWERSPCPMRVRVAGVGYVLLAVGVGLVALGGYVGYVAYPRFGLPAVDGAASWPR